MNYRKCLLMAIVLFHAPTWAINKCTGADGKVVFQDAPCMGRGEVLDIRPASGQRLQPTAGAQPLTEAQRIEGQVSNSMKERRVRELQTLWIPRAEEEILANKQACVQQTRNLENKKDRYVQNLAGATYRASVTSELAAHVTACESKDRELKEALAALREECKKLGCK